MYESLIRSIVPLDQDPGEGDGERIVLGVTSEEWVPHMNRRFREPLQSKLATLMGREVIIVFEPTGNSGDAIPEDSGEMKSEPGSSHRTHGSGEQSNKTVSWLNPFYTFETFFQSKSNALACLAFQKAAETPGMTNPLYVYGDAGLGKTHLVHAMVHSALRRQPSLRVACIGIEEFREEFQEALAARKTLEFKNRYKKFDLLIVEDFHLLKSTSEATMEEFFHIFNYYFERGRQIVITADRPASALKIPSRLMSRLLSGLQVPLHPPDLSLRKAYLIHRAAELELPVSGDILRHLSEEQVASIRELDSSLNKLYFLRQRGVDISDLKAVSPHLHDLRDYSLEESQSHNPERILNAVCEYYNVTREDILGSSRKAEVTLPRHIAIYLCVRHTTLNKSSIARFFQKSDHTTVINAEKRIQSRLQKESGLKRNLEQILNMAWKSGG